MYMCDSATDVYSDYDMSANAMFYRTKRIVTDYLRHRYQMSSVERNGMLSVMECTKILELQ